MRFEPPDKLAALLSRLELVTPEQLAAAAPRAARLAGDLPDFESVWVDALAQARVLSPFQAAEINTGRAEALRHGPYIVTHRLPGPHFAECFAARHAESGRSVRLYVMRGLRSPAVEAAAALKLLLDRCASLERASVSLVEEVATSGQTAWAACTPLAGSRASDWIVEHGRLPPRAVLHVAREMSARLATLERASIVHGDLFAGELFLQASGQIALGAPGLRVIARPQEGYSFGDLRPEAYDCLAPERIAEGTPPTVAGDVYACGCLWTHLLTGRPTFPGGDSLAKLKAVHAARRIDVRQYVPDVPEALHGAIESCLARRPEDRPQSFDRLVEMLGPPTRAGAALVAQLVRRPTSTWHLGLEGEKARRPSPITRAALAAATAALVAGLALSPLALRRLRQDEPHAADAKPVGSATAAVAKTPQPASVPRERENPSLRLPDAGAVYDPQVVPAAARATVSPDEDLVLPAGRILRVEQLDLRPNVRVRGRAGRRPVVSVPRRGLVVGCEDVTFDGVDFVWEGNAGDAASAPAVLVVEAQTVSFRGCSFSTKGPPHASAIVWSGNADSQPGLGAEIAFVDCVFDGLACCVEWLGAGGCTVSLENVLCLEAGPVLRVHRCLQPGEPLALVLNRVTTRGSSPALECRYRSLEETPGAIAISATDSALAGSADGGLVVLRGADNPERLARSLTWSGHGSVVTPEVSVVVWRAGSGRVEVLPEEDLEIAGLVRGELGFAGPIDGPPADARVTRWQVPLRSPDPPGASPHVLPALPRGSAAGEAREERRAEKVDRAAP
jgi:hypothetical protein